MTSPYPGTHGKIEEEEEKQKNKNKSQRGLFWSIGSGSQLRRGAHTLVYSKKQEPGRGPAAPLETAGSVSIMSLRGDVCNMSI